MKDFVTDLITAILIVLAAVGGVLLIYFAGDTGAKADQARAERIKRDQEHERQQITECKALGGFARTTVNGQLLSCTFPPSLLRGER